MKKKGPGHRLDLLIEGDAQWPHLDVPDSYSHEGKEPRVEYKVNLKVSDDTLKSVKAKLTKLAADFMASEGVDVDEDWRPKLPLKRDKETKEISILVKSGADYKPPLFDAKNRRLPDSVVVGGGSKLRVKVTAVPYALQGGLVTLYINAVQVLKLEAKKGFDGNSPFDEVDGYEFDGNDEAESQTSSKEELDDEIPF